MESIDSIVKELETLAQTPGVTPKQLRQKAREEFNGSLASHPLITHSANGVAMRIELSDGKRWIPVPEAWLGK